MANKALAVLALLGGAAVVVAVATRAKAEPIPGTATLLGTITDADNGFGLPGVSVAVNGYSGQTDGVGNFQVINITPGDYTVVLTKAGYETVVI